MGMGHAAAYADVIDVKEVKKICPIEFKQFLTALKTDDVDLEEFAMEYDSGNGEDFAPTAYEIFGILQAAFETKTAIDGSDGLELGIAHHQSDEYGDRYDEVDGTYFYVDGMYCLTEAGEKMDSIVQRKTFVQFG